MLLLVGAVRHLAIYHAAILVLDTLISYVAGTNHCAPSFKFRLKILAMHNNPNHGWDVYPCR